MYYTYAVCLLIHHPSVNLNSLEAKYLWLKLLGTFSGEKLGQAMKGNNGRTNGITCRELMKVFSGVPWFDINTLGKPTLLLSLRSKSHYHVFFKILLRIFDSHKQRQLHSAYCIPKLAGLTFVLPPGKAVFTDYLSNKCESCGFSESRHSDFKIVHNISHRDENCETRRMGRTTAEAKHEQNSESVKFYFYWLWHDKVPFVKDILASKNKQFLSQFNRAMKGVFR